MKFSMPRGGAPVIEGSSWVRAEGGDLPHAVLIRLGLSEDDRLVATGLLVEADGELTSRALRLPLADIVAEFAVDASKPSSLARYTKELLGIDVVFHGEVPAELPGAWRALLPVTAKRHPVRRRTRPGRRGYPDAHYREIAKAYRRAKRQHPRAPIQALMIEQNQSEATVHRWLRTAREKGFIKTTKEN